ncbi:MarR family transcriptional regulator [bacterium C-53]|nr:MarR family transcriptional regulator [Lachnospiraceae bacterium]NBI03800.1 MarR family transcriptional regulator [Lachnospiraceae bacterium]RKJ09147.1 MarR family transcriptional regulator [bacterium C-53]
MKNEELTKEVIIATRNATIAYHNYMYTDREYIKGQKLYLREMHFLLYIGPGNELTMSEIARKMNITQGAATQIAARLIKKGFVQKDKHPDDKRYSVISLTAEGVKAYEEYQEYDSRRNKEITAYMDEYFSEEDIKIILRYENLIQEICNK